MRFIVSAQAIILITRLKVILLMLLPHFPGTTELIQYSPSGENYVVGLFCEFSVSGDAKQCVILIYCGNDAIRNQISRTWIIK